MKKGCLLLLSILFLTYGYQGYKVLYKYKNDEVKIKTYGNLSDITGKITPVPLETPDSGAVHRAKRVQRDGNHLFLLSDNRLLHFDVSGRFINQPAAEISGREDVFIADYTLDTDRRQVIVVDSLRNVSRYDYDGNLLSTVHIKHPWRKLTALAYHSGHLWMTAEKWIKNNEEDTYQIVHSLYQLDMEMNEITNRKLSVADIGRDIPFHTFCVDELLADEHGIYAYTTPVDMEHLLNDTLYILQCQTIPAMRRAGHFGMACIYPVRKGKRYIMSTFHNETDNGHTFCYDNANHTAYMLTDGFKDDIYNTGHITDFQPMDIYNETYCFLKSGTDIVGKFPDRAVNQDQSVLFIVTLNV